VPEVAEVLMLVVLVA
jgi:hypothetical protein